MKIETQYYEDKIKEKIRDLWAFFKGNNAEWTRETFRTLMEIGVHLGYESKYSSKYGGPGEWLWDFIWVKRDYKGSIIEVPLVAESEWQTSDLKIDFEKLVVSSAPLRLFIFQTQTEERAIVEISKLKALSDTYCVCPAKYLAACWIWGVPNSRPFFDSWPIEQI